MNAIKPVEVSSTSCNYRRANRIVLHDHYTVLTAPDMEGGIFGEYENETWRIDAEWITRLLTAIGVDVRRQPKDAMGLHLEIDRIPAHTGKHIYADAYLKEMAGIDQIEARVLGVNHLDLRLAYNRGTNDEFVSEITYCGGFTVEWAP